MSAVWFLFCIPPGGSSFEVTMVEKSVQIASFLTSAARKAGRRYGTSTCVISRLLSNSGSQIVVEPDETVWSALEENLRRNDCSAFLYKGAISTQTLRKSKERSGSEWTTKFEHVEEDGEGMVTIPTTTFEDLEATAGVVIDTMVIDCEGCFDQFLQEFPTAVDGVRTILLEGDYGQGWQRYGTADYARVEKFLTSRGFRCAVEAVIQDYPLKEQGKIKYFVFLRSEHSQ